MEDELQTKLFVRNNQTLVLTEAGNLYFDFFDNTRQRFENLQTTLRSEQPPNTITVAYLEGLNITQALLDNVFAVGEQHHMHIDLQTYDMHNLPQIVQEGLQDFILTYQGPRLDMFTDYVYSPVETVNMVLVVGKVLSPNQEADTTRYEKYPVVTWLRKGQSTEQAIQQCIQHCMDFGFHCHNVHVAPNRDTARVEIETGHCIGICTAIDRMAYSPAVFTLPLRGTSTIVCMWAKNNRSPVVRKIARDICNQKENAGLK